MPNDKTLIKPPPKDKAHESLGFVQDYDSVSGETSGSKVFMIYENGRAYPEYLITYGVSEKTKEDVVKAVQN